MRKTHFTRKNLIALAMVFFYGLMILVAALMIDGNNPMFAKNNPIQSLTRSLFPLPTLDGRVTNGVPLGSIQSYILIVLFVIYLLVCSGALMYEVRLAKYYDEKPTSKKWWFIYILTFVLCLGLWIGISMVSQISDKPFPYYIGTSFIFLGESILMGTLIFAILFLLVFNIAAIVINFKHIDQPFRFFDNKAMEQKELEEELEAEEKAKEQGELESSFTGTSSTGTGVGEGGNGSCGAGGSGNGDGEDVSPLKDKERVFPGLCTIDYESMTEEPEEFEDNLSLEELCVQFRNYLASKEGLFFSLKTVREFIAGLAASRLIILEGLSGTGKSSLARYFSEFINEKSYFEAVQATWRDRTSVLGYYNDFSKTYNETEFLKRLYRYTYKEDHINVMVLDELNISRIEYYFADFLSVLEYPEDEWKLKIMQFPYDFEAPEHLTDGILQIPANTYFIGTANKDESTFTITDKVYDRAITIDFDDRNEPFEVEGPSDKITLSHHHLKELFSEAIENEENQLTMDDYKRFKNLTDFTYDTFDLTFGNRILHQIQLFVPVFVACGGTKEEALDFMFSRKVVAKLEGRFEDYIKQGLIDLKGLISRYYGLAKFPQTCHIIDKFIRKL